MILLVADQRLDEYLRWWLEHEALMGKPGRAPLAATTPQGYRINAERHLIPALGRKRVGLPTVSDLDAFASRKLAEGYAPSRSTASGKRSARRCLSPSGSTG